jgi:hypothetical protein
MWGMLPPAVTWRAKRLGGRKWLESLM